MKPCVFSLNAVVKTDEARPLRLFFTYSTYSRYVWFQFLLALTETALLVSLIVTVEGILMGRSLVRGLMHVGMNVG